jgi:hypothetical protein
MALSSAVSARIYWRIVTKVASTKRKTKVIASNTNTDAGIVDVALERRSKKAAHKQTKTAKLLSAKLKKRRREMSVVTSTFGGVRLTGDDAKKFRQQVTYGRPKKAAKETYARGSKLAKKFAKDGYVILKAAR